LKRSGSAARLVNIPAIDARDARASNDGVGSRAVPVGEAPRRVGRTARQRRFR
jgi:hypothetical protein